VPQRERSWGNAPIEREGLDEAGSRGRPDDRSENGKQLSADQMTPLQKQRSRCALGIARGAKRAAFEAVEDAIRRKETVAALVFRDDARGVASDFDDIGVGHDGLSAGPAGAPV
jgi:hypothetical protein